MAAPTYSSGFPTVTVTQNPLTVSAQVDTIFAGLTTTDPFSFLTLPAIKFVAGTAAGQINAISKIYTGTLAATTLDLDLTTLVDKYGQAINFSKVRGLLVINGATTDGFNLLVGGATTNAWAAPFNGVATSKIVVPPGLSSGGVTIPNYFALYAPNTTGLATSGTSKVLRLDSGANSVPYAVFAFGVGV